MKATITLTLDADADEAIAYIMGCVLTRDQAKTVTVKRHLGVGTDLSVTTNDVMSVLRQFEEDGFELESSFTRVTIQPVEE